MADIPVWRYEPDAEPPLNNHLILPYKLFAKLKDCKIVADRMVPPDCAFAVDAEGRVHQFDYAGMYPRPSDEAGDG